MARTIYTDEQIISAGRRLEERGETPISSYSLREEIGGGKAKRMFKVWTDATQSTDVIEKDEELNIRLPPEIQDSVNIVTADVVKHIEDTIIKCNAIATKIADKRVSETLSDMKKTIAKVEHSENEASTAIDKCDDIIEDQKEEIAVLNSESLKLSNKIAKLEANNDEFKRNEESANKKIAELNKLLSDSVKAKSEVDINVAVLNKATATLEQKTIDLQQALSKSEKSNATLEVQNVELVKQVDQSNQNLAKTNVKIEDVTNNLTDAKIKLATEEGKSSEQKLHIHELNNTIEELHLKIKTVELGYNSQYLAKDENDKANGNDK